MAVTKTDRIIRMTADDDVYSSGLKALQIKGVRLVTAAADSTAQLRKTNDSGDIILSLTALAKTADESVIPLQVDGGVIHLDLSGAGAEVFIYLE